MDSKSCVKRLIERSHELISLKRAVIVFAVVEFIVVVAVVIQMVQR